MKSLLLEKIRLSWFFVAFFIGYFILLGLLPGIKVESSALTLFSVNSFLYGFYISPILNAQKARIEDLHRIVRAEANAIFSIMLATKKLHSTVRSKLYEMTTAYLRDRTRGNFEASEKTYERLISYCLEYDGKDKEQVDKLLEKIVANQQNRTNLSMQLSNRVFSNEWMIMMVLFSITLSFVLLLGADSGWSLRLVTALLCTGLSMLILILVKLSTLTHKKAKQMWKPFNVLLKTDFYRIDQSISD